MRTREGLTGSMVNDNIDMVKEFGAMDGGGRRGR